MLSKLKKLTAISLVAIALFSSCNKGRLNEQEVEQKNTYGKALVALGVKAYNYQIENSNLINAEFVDAESNLKNIVSLEIDTLYRRSKITLKNSSLNFTMVMDEREKTFKFSSSKGDSYEFIFRSKDEIGERNATISGWYVKGTDDLQDADWVSKIKIDSKLMFKAHNILGDLIKEGKFIDPISVIKKRQSEVLLKQRALEMKKSKQFTSSAFGQPCEDSCVSDGFYGFWRTEQCNSAYENLAIRCSNRYCIGNCGSKSCDCFTISGDFGVICKAFGHACSGPQTPNE